MLPPDEICRRARLTRDAKFDGRLFVAELSAEIYCRPTCGRPLQKEDNVKYYSSAAAAQRAGLRPCSSCRPEWAHLPPEWALSNPTLVRALRLIEAGYLNDAGLADLANQLGVGYGELSHLFMTQLDASPRAIAQLWRVRLAYELLKQTNLRLVDVAVHAGFSSVGSMSASVQKTYRQRSGQIRPEKSLASASRVALDLSIRGPYDHDWIFEYLERRALAGIETVSGSPGQWRYSRRLRDGVYVSVYQVGRGLRADLPLVDEPLHQLLTRIRQVFDLRADGDAIHRHLVQDPFLSEWVVGRPGLRVPGAWDGFESAVRAVLGQQVSVERGTVLANKMVEVYGHGRFPGPEALVDRDVAEIGMPGQRGRAISLLCRAVLQGELSLEDSQGYETVHDRLEQIPGIGPWTANYIRMRVLKDPDAFPDNDWVVLKALDCTAAGARRLAEFWQPWRAYGLMYLWSASKTLRARQVSE